MDMQDALTQLLSGLAYVHGRRVMHRDLKPANLLVGWEGELKIADFGQACLFFPPEEGRTYSHQVATRAYRAPELLYGARSYTEAVDLWAVGCIFGEMLTGAPVFQSASDIEALVVVQKALGTPTEAAWPGLSALPDYAKISFPAYPKLPLATLFPMAEASAVELLGRLLVYEPSRRLSAAEALASAFLLQDPQPTRRRITAARKGIGGWRQRHEM